MSFFYDNVLLTMQMIRHTLFIIHALFEFIFWKIFLLKDFFDQKFLLKQFFLPENVLPTYFWTKNLFYSKTFLNKNFIYLIHIKGSMLTQYESAKNKGRRKNATNEWKKRQIYSKIRVCRKLRGRKIWGCIKIKGTKIKGTKFEGAHILMGIR